MAEWLKSICYVPFRYGLDKINYLTVNVVHMFINLYGKRLLVDDSSIIEKHQCVENNDLFWLYPLHMKPMEQSIGSNLIDITSCVITGTKVSVPWSHILSEPTVINISTIRALVSVSTSTATTTTTTTASKSGANENQSILAVYCEIRSLLSDYMYRIVVDIDQIELIVTDCFRVVINNLSYANGCVVIKKIQIFSLVMDGSLLLLSAHNVRYDETGLEIDDLVIDSSFVEHVHLFSIQDSSEPVAVEFNVRLNRCCLYDLEMNGVTCSLLSTGYKFSYSTALIQNTIYISSNSFLITYDRLNNHWLTEGSNSISLIDWMALTNWYARFKELVNCASEKLIIGNENELMHFRIENVAVNISFREYRLELVTSSVIIEKSGNIVVNGLVANVCSTRVTCASVLIDTVTGRVECQSLQHHSLTVNGSAFIKVDTYTDTDTDTLFVSNMMVNIDIGGVHTTTLTVERILSSSLLINSICCYVNPNTCAALVDYQTVLQSIFASNMNRVTVTQAEQPVAINILEESVAATSMCNLHRIVNLHQTIISSLLTYSISIKFIHCYLMNSYPSDSHSHSCSSDAILCFVLKDTTVLVDRSAVTRLYTTVSVSESIDVRPLVRYQIDLSIGHWYIVDMQSPDLSWKYFAKVDTDTRTKLAVTVHGAALTIQLESPHIVATIREETLLELLVFIDSTSTSVSPDTSDASSVYYDSVTISEIVIDLSYYPVTLQRIDAGSSLLSIQNHMVRLPEISTSFVPDTHQLINRLYTAWSNSIHFDSIIPFIPNLNLLQPCYHYSTPIVHIYSLVSHYIQFPQHRITIGSIARKITKRINNSADFTSYLMQKGIKRLSSLLN